MSQDSLFIPLQGERFDGHDFIAQAIAGGAKGVLIQKTRRIDLQPSVMAFPVEDTFMAFRQLAKHWRKQVTCPVIAIGGSFGKTTTKEFLFALLQGKWRNVLKTEGSQNGFVGIPMTLMRLRPEHAAAVIEIGIDEIGAMQKHVEIVAPTASLVTGIGPEHLEKLKDVPTVASEEKKLLELTAKAGGTVAVNLDDPWLRPVAQLMAGNQFHYSLNNPVTVGLLVGKYHPQSSLLEIQEGGTPWRLQVPLPGIHNAQNLLAAVALAKAVGLTPKEITAGLRLFKGAEGRSELKQLPNGVSVLCDYYNASPPSMEAALDLLQSLFAESKNSNAKKWACLGDMLELGNEEESWHRGLAEKIIALSIDSVLLYGTRMKRLEDELHRRKFKGFLSHFTSHAALAEVLAAKVQKEDLVLIKGSRGMKMEEVWKALQNRWPSGEKAR